MCDGNDKNNSKNRLNSSKELLYPDFTGTTVVEHVLNSLQKPSHLTRSEEINKFFKSKGEKSGAFERAKRFLSLMEEGDTGTCLEASAEDEEAIEVHLTIGKDEAEDKTEDYKADAWFILPQSKAEEKSENCLSNLLDFDEDSSDSDGDLSDDEDSQHVSFERKDLIIEEESADVDDECNPL